MADGNFFARKVAPRQDKGAVPLWRARLRTNKGETIPSLANAMVIFANDPELAEMLGYNEFSSRAVMLQEPPPTEGVTPPGPFPRAWEEADRAFALAYLQRAYSQKFRMETVSAAMSGAAVSKRFHPVREYLDGLVWDRVPRIGTWLVDAFGADQDPYHHAVGTKFLQAAVRRVRRPGCKFDSVLILEGSQDIGKSMAVRHLFGDDWFTDNLPVDLTGKDICDAMQGVWGVEFAEIEHLLRTSPETTKAFLSRQIDRYRPSYGRMPVERPRQCVFIGTTNNDDYARDSTGNRRLWPVRCQTVNRGWIADWRDQLWAEACATEPDATLWLDDDGVREDARQHQAARHDDDPWQDGILTFVAGRERVAIPDIMGEHLCLSKDKQDKRAQMRVAGVLRRAGWHRSLIQKSGVQRRLWLSKSTLE